MTRRNSRQAEINAWLKGLDEPKRTIAVSALDIFNNVVVGLGMTGACYRLAFFLTEYLKFKHGIETVPVVGFINDGTDELMISHAWVEYEGFKIDLAIANTEDYPAGDLMILDHVLIPGELRYSYHRVKTEESDKRAAQEAAIDPRWHAVIRRKGAEHAWMLDVCKSSSSRRAYLNQAPDGYDFPTLCHLAG
jgi:hypothetical protein